MDQYRVSELTVLRRDANGEVYDLNAEGEPCADDGEVVEILEQLAPGIGQNLGLKLAEMGAQEEGWTATWWTIHPSADRNRWVVDAGSEYWIGGDAPTALDKAHCDLADVLAYIAAFDGKGGDEESWKKIEHAEVTW